MSREGRTLLLLGIFALGAVAVLGTMAKRYGTMLEGRGAHAAAGRQFVQPAPIDDLDVALDRFAAVRRAMHAALESRAAQATVPETLGAARRQALVESSMSLERYVAVRTLYRSWRIGAPLPSGAASAFDARSDRLRASELGAYESLDR